MFFRNIPEKDLEEIGKNVDWRTDSHAEEISVEALKTLQGLLQVLFRLPLEHLPVELNTVNEVGLLLVLSAIGQPNFDNEDQFRLSTMAIKLLHLLVHQTHGFPFAVFSDIGSVFSWLDRLGKVSCCNTVVQNFSFLAHLF